MSTLRTAQDFTAAVLWAYEEMVARAAQLHGSPRLEHGPSWVATDNGMVRRVSTVWFIPRNTGFRVEERGHATRAWEVGAWNHAGPITSAEVSFRRPPTADDIADVARRVGLLPPLVEVTRLGSAEREYVEGTCDGWPNGAWHGPDCGNREPHASH